MTEEEIGPSQVMNKRVVSKGVSIIEIQMPVRVSLKSKERRGIIER